jgi:hypothetical protein
VKRFCADDSAATSVKVGYRQASYKEKPPPVIRWGFFAFLCTSLVGIGLARFAYTPLIPSLIEAN